EKRCQQTAGQAATNISVPNGAQGIPLPQIRNLTTPNHAPGDLDPQQRQKLLEESKMTQVMVETSEGNLEIKALPPPQLPVEGGAPRPPEPHGLRLYSPDPSRWGSRPRSGRSGAGGGRATRGGCGSSLCLCGSRQQPEKWLSACNCWGEGPRNLWPRAVGRSGSELMMTGAKAAEAKTERGTIFSEAVDEEERVEVEEKPVGEEMEVVEEHRGVNEVKDEARPRPRMRADRAFLQFGRNFGRMRQHYLQWRNIPGFRVTTVRNHPQLSALIRGRDAEMFRNNWTVKEYEVRSSGHVVFLSTPIIWHPGREPQAFLRRNQDLMCSFFAWFSDHSLPESDRIAEIIKEDLWPTPLQYYLWDEGAHRARLLQTREPAEIPRPFGFQSGLSNCKGVPLADFVLTFLHLPSTGH
ncbi:hypothetical protein E2I00_001116, partial [Balaenoptera physalus]